MAAHTVFNELGIPHTEDKRIIESIGRPMDAFLRNILPDDIAPEDVREKFHLYENQAIREHGTLFPGIADALNRLAAEGHILTVCSNGSNEYIELVLLTTGIRKLFQNVCTASQHESKAKLVSEILKHDEQAAFIGDSFDDIEAGLRNKIPAIAAMYGYGNKEYLKTATFTVSEPGEIIGCIHQLAVFAQIVTQLIKNGSRILGINGIDTSGKTIFTDSFSLYLRSLGYQCAVIHIDDYHNPIEIRRQGANEIDAYYDNAFNYKQLTEEILEPLRRVGTIDKDVLCLNLDTDKYENIIHYYIDGETIVLLEGVLLFRPPILNYLDGKIYIYIDFDELLNRARERDVPKYGEAFLQKYIDKYIPIQKRYLEEFKPQAYCDIYIDNNDYLYPRIL